MDTYLISYSKKYVKIQKKHIPSQHNILVRTIAAKFISSQITI